MTREELITQAVLQALKEKEQKTPAPASDYTPYTKKMTLKLAKILVERIEEKAKEWGMKIVVAVSDDRGRIIAIHCMDGCFYGSYEVAVNKTYTATAFQMPTKKLADLCKPGGDLYGLQFGNDGKVMILGGGEPLYIGDTLIGALAVSGDTAEMDTKLGEYGVEVFKEVTNGCR